MKSLRLFWKYFLNPVLLAMGAVSAVITIYAAWHPSGTLDMLKRIEAHIISGMPSAPREGITILEFWQAYNDANAIEYTMLRYYNPSPAQALRDVRAALYMRNDENVFVKIYEEQIPYIAPENARDIFDIGIKERLGNPVLFCASYMAANKPETIAIPLAAEPEDRSSISYRQSGDTAILDDAKAKTCDLIAAGM